MESSSGTSRKVKGQWIHLTYRASFSIANESHSLESGRCRSYNRRKPEEAGFFETSRWRSSRAKTRSRSTKLGRIFQKPAMIVVSTMTLYSCFHGALIGSGSCHFVLIRIVGSRIPCLRYLHPLASCSSSPHLQACLFCVPMRQYSSFGQNSFIDETHLRTVSYQISMSISMRNDQ